MGARDKRLGGSFTHVDKLSRTTTSPSSELWKAEEEGVTGSLKEHKV